MRKSRKCPKCGSSAIQHGKLYSQGGIWFEPQVKRSLLNLMPARAEMAASACLTCGFIELYIHRLEKLIQAVTKPDEAEDTSSQDGPGSITRSGGVTEITLD